MKHLIITLLSDQPIPNVQFIKEKQNNESIYFFISTQKMEEKGVGSWIRKVCNICTETTITKIVDQFSPSDIENKLNEISYEEYDKIVVNVTGGTKIMSHIVTEFFKEKPDTEIYYLTGLNNNYLQVFPKTKQPVKSMMNRLTLREYIECFGFEMSESSLSGIAFTYTQDFLQKFVKFGENEWRIINKLRETRGKTAEINKIVGLQDFLCNILFPLSDENFLTISKKEVKYLTGDWFEEYIYYRLKQELPIAEDNIKTGITLKKNNIPNEFDVVFLWAGNLYTIECKTSIINKMVEEMNILNETIYKVTAIQKNLGLNSKFSVFTLSSKMNNEVKATHLERGKLFNIDVFSREDIIESQSIVRLLKLESC